MRLEAGLDGASANLRRCSVSAREQSDTSRLEFIAEMALSAKQSTNGLTKLEQHKQWRGKVYHQTKDEGNREEYWDNAHSIFKRDKHTCQACFRSRTKLFRRGLYLSVHHIIPRSEGGTYERDNLVTLCNQCHDVVEEKQYRSIGAIRGCQTGDYRHYQVGVSPDTDWHKWVYGGYKKPARH